MGRMKNSDDEKVVLTSDYRPEDLILDNNSTIDIYAGVTDSMYAPYAYNGGGYDTIDLNNLDLFSDDLTVKGDINIGGVSLKSWIETVNHRLNILQPKPELLEKYAALQKAYDHYKTLENLLHNADKINPPT